MKKTVSILIPTYNEQENISIMIQTIKSIFLNELKNYKYEIVVIDNDSVDNTRDILREECANDKNVKAIFNSRNYGQFNSPYYGLCQTSGDCSIVIVADFQEPVEMIPKFVREWEKGYLIVCGIKTESKENPFMYFLREIYYRLIGLFSDVHLIRQFSGFALYDQKIVDIMKTIKDPTPFLRGVVAEIGYKVQTINYTQNKRKAGKSKNNIATLFDGAMLSVTSYTKIGVRLCLLIGILSCLFSFIGFIIRLFFTPVNNEIYVIINVLTFFFGILMFFIGFIGEYILAINQRVMDRPLVIEEERINFEKK